MSWHYCPIRCYVYSLWQNKMLNTQNKTFMQCSIYSCACAPTPSPWDMVQLQVLALPQVDLPALALSAWVMPRHPMYYTELAWPLSGSQRLCFLCMCVHACMCVFETHKYIIVTEFTQTPFLNSYFLMMVYFIDNVIYSSIWENWKTCD